MKQLVSSLAILALPLVIVGCSSGSSPVASDHPDSGHRDAAKVDAGHPADASRSKTDAPTFAIPAMCGGDGGASGRGGGTVEGAGVDGTLCTSDELELDMYGSRQQLLFNISAGQSTFQSPAGANTAQLFGSLGITEAKPGTYASSGPGACGTLSFLYDLPSPAGLNCATAATPTSPSDCPPGCGTACSGLGCEPCKPAPPEIGYAAVVGTFDCDGSPQGPATGSWTLTLTSVTKNVPDASTVNPPVDQPQTYDVHGTLSVSMTGSANSGGDAGSGTVQLALTF